ncbi:MAG: excinuclease ABC subunit UvrC [Campylobacterota bacterium]|nr:excinuclease ABC subunit UvrC [Campylobacterota bacterium]
MLQQIKSLPSSPGIYQYFDARGRLLYIGKAKNLANRVKSYFRFTPHLAPNPTLSLRILKMLNETVSLHYIIVESEHDALILENSLIKQLKPKYNILLRDDKTYPYIYIDLNQPYPRFEITRKIIEGKNVRYFGPYSTGARDILNAIYELCRLVQKKGCLKGKKACLYHQLDKCLAPCEKRVTLSRYQEEVEKAIRFIENKPELIDRLQQKMDGYAESLRFEEAATLRDQIERIDKSQLLSQIDLANRDDYDIFAIAHNDAQAAVVRLFMRNGKVVSSSHDLLSLNEGLDLDEAYERTLLGFYGHEKPPVIAPILVGDAFDTSKLVTEHLTQLFGKKAHITHPLRGTKKRLIELARTNAAELLKQRHHKSNDTLPQALKELCQLQRIPYRIETFDNSHISGEAPVGGMVTFDNGAFDKSGYRHYHLESRDEYAQMRETLTRRIEGFESNPPPDLWIIDGGSTLLGLANDLLASQGVFLDVIAISKEKVDAKAHRAKGGANDEIHTLDQSFKLAKSDKRLQWVQRMRDEAHRFAITFHKKTKLKRDQESKLLQLKGISAAKIKKLLNHFGTFEAVAQSSECEIASILSAHDAKIIKEMYK